MQLRRERAEDRCLQHTDQPLETRCITAMLTCQEIMCNVDSRGTWESRWTAAAGVREENRYSAFTATLTNIHSLLFGPVAGELLWSQGSNTHTHTFSTATTIHV